MKITDYLRAENIFLDVDLPDKDAVLHFIAEACAKNGIVRQRSRIYEGLVQREETMSTGVGNGLAFPHTTSEEAEEAAVMLLRLARPVDFDALDKNPVSIVLALIIPQKDTDMHVRLLARVSRLCREDSFVQSVRDAADSPALDREIRNLEKSTAYY
ncbi:MAG: PTS sugar transporter subunit IIA [Desulfobacterales bacterium]|nr:PTS sugar transporter subunit IIA [Desulfobacterales bacterium]MBS3755496.1 PTS sugar transporter subunit IIA [Desulfobacterales bacterium]